MVSDKGMTGVLSIITGIENGVYENSDKMWQHARDHGITYSTDDIKGFFNTYGNREIEGYPGYSPEYRTYLYDEGGMVRIGNEAIEGGINMVASGKPNKPNSIARMHTHPNAGKSAGFAQTYMHRPSNWDYTTPYTGNRYHDVVVSPKYIYFINSNSSQSFVVPMRETFTSKINQNPWRK